MEHYTADGHGLALGAAYELVALDIVDAGQAVHAACC